MTAPSEPTALLHRLAADASIELTPGEWKRRGPDLVAPVAADARVYLTFLTGDDPADAVAATAGVAATGRRPVPHLAARSVLDDADLDRTVGRLAAAGAQELLLVAGSLATPRGRFSQSVQILESGVLERHGILRVGVAGHPEGNRDIGEDGLRRALQRKNEIARSAPYAMYLVTQFGFAAAPIVDWERRIAAEGNTLPVRVGLPGLASLAKVIRFGIACGVGASLKVLRRQPGTVVRLASGGGTYRPDTTLAGLVRAMAQQPSRLTAIHLYPFGAVAETAGWLADLMAATVESDGRSDRLHFAGPAGR